MRWPEPCGSKKTVDLLRGAFVRVEVVHQVPYACNQLVVLRQVKIQLRTAAVVDIAVDRRRVYLHHNHARIHLHMVGKIPIHPLIKDVGLNAFDGACTGLAVVIQAVFIEVALGQLDGKLFDGVG